MNTHPNSAVEILQLLLRCGMVCQEELKVVLEMMPVRFRQPGADDAETGYSEPGDAGGGGSGAGLRGSTPAAGVEAIIPTKHADIRL